MILTEALSTVARDNRGRAIGYTVARDNDDQDLGLTIAGGSAQLLDCYCQRLQQPSPIPGTPEVDMLILLPPEALTDEVSTQPVSGQG